MRPDPYKRARSRQYKAKHGIPIVSKKQVIQPDLPSNISEESLSGLIFSEDQDELDFQFEAFEDLKLSDLSKSSSSELPYKYPKELFDKIYQVTRRDEIYSPANETRYDDFRFEHTRPEDFIIQLSTKNQDDSKTDKLPASPKLKLDYKKDLEKLADSSISAKPRQEKLELEDWLDEVL